MPALIDFAGFIATLSSQIMGLSALPSIIEIYKSKSTLAYPPEPYIASLANCLINIAYAVVARRWIVFFSVILSTVTSSCFFSIHYRYSKDPSGILTQLIKRVVIVSLILVIVPVLTAPFVHADVLKTVTLWWWGLGVTVGTVIMYFAQLRGFKEIIATKSSASISPHLTAGTTFSVWSWMIYSCMIGDMWYVACSALGIVSCSIQIFFLYRYPRSITPEYANMESKPNDIGKSADS